MSNTKNSEHKVEPSLFHTILRKKKKKSVYVVYYKMNV